MDQDSLFTSLSLVQRGEHALGFLPLLQKRTSWSLNSIIQVGIFFLALRVLLLSSPEQTKASPEMISPIKISNYRGKYSQRSQMNRPKADA